MCEGGSELLLSGRPGFVIAICLFLFSLGISKEPSDMDEIQAVAREWNGWMDGKDGKQ